MINICNDKDLLKSDDEFAQRIGEKFERIF